MKQYATLPPLIRKCPYGECRMRNLCRTYCVRKSLEDNGWRLNVDGDLEKVKDGSKHQAHNQEPEAR